MNTIKYDYPKFTKDMIKTHTILVPDMLPIHFELILHLFREKGYKFEVLKNTDQTLIDKGLRFVHNDICYPCMLVIGQFIDALDSGKYDLNKVALAITQTGGGCRASNYIHLLRNALKNAGYGHIPVMSINFAGMEKDNTLKFTLPLLKQARAAVVYGDMLYLLSNHYKSYEVNKGDTDRLVWSWVEKIKPLLKKSDFKTTKRLLKQIFDDFNKIKVNYTPKIKVGIVGEIYVKYAALGNNCLEEFLREQNCEVVVPGLMGFVIYCVANNVLDSKLYGRNRLQGFVFNKVLKNLGKWELLIKEVIGDDKRFFVPGGYKHLFKLTKGVIDLGVKMGEGWLLPGEMVELTEAGVNNIVCAQPFGCLPNHIVGKSVLKRIKEIYPMSNITPIDYDASASRVNQENRIKLMLAVAKEQMETETLVYKKIEKEDFNILEEVKNKKLAI